MSGPLGASSVPVKVFLDALHLGFGDGESGETPRAPYEMTTCPAPEILTPCIEFLTFQKIVASYFLWSGVWVFEVASARS